MQGSLESRGRIPSLTKVVQMTILKLIFKCIYNFLTFAASFLIEIL
jgi:hypothetical protein